MPRGPFNPNAPFWFMLRDAEKRILENAFKAAGSVESAAKLLGITRHTFLKHALPLEAEIPAEAMERFRTRKQPPVSVRNKVEELERLRRSIDKKLEEYRDAGQADGDVSEGRRDPVAASK